MEVSIHVVGGEVGDGLTETCVCVGSVQDVAKIAASEEENFSVQPLGQVSRQVDRGSVPQGIELAELAGDRGRNHPDGRKRIKRQHV